MVQRRERRTKVDGREQEDNYKPGKTDPLLRREKGENLRWSHPNWWAKGDDGREKKNRGMAVGLEREMECWIKGK